MKAILLHLKNNWIKYGFETFVIVISILGAFALNNWNEDRKEKRNEQVHLNNLYQDLLVEKENLKAMIIRRESKAKSATRMLNYYNGRKIESLTSYYYDLINVILEDQHNPNNNSFMELINSGNLSILKSEELRLLLLEIDSDYKLLKDSELHHLKDNQRHLYSSFGSTVDFESATMAFMDSTATIDLSQKDVEVALQNRSIKNGFFLAMFMNNHLTSLLNPILEKVDECIGMIEEQLK